MSSMNCQPQSARDIQKEEYEVQLYGYEVNDIFLYFRDSLEDYFNQLMEDLQTILLKRKGSNVEDISAAREALIKLWKGASFVFYEKLKEAVKQYFEIPSPVLLPEDKVHILSYHAEEEKEIDKNLKELTNKLASVRMMKQYLEQENLSLNKSQALEKQLSESSVLDSFNIDRHHYESTLPSNIKRIMKIVNDMEEHNENSY